MKRVIGSIVAVALVFIGARPASAQDPTGLYAGADFGSAFGTLDFKIVYPDSPSCCNTVNGRVSASQFVGARFGINHRVGPKVVVGGEAGFGWAHYHGEVRYGAGQDTLGQTDGGIYWTAVARAGYAIDRVMPYFAAGVMNSGNRAQVADTCNTLPCEGSLGGGSNTTSTTRWMYALGAEVSTNQKIAGRAWLLRVEWAEFEQTPVLNAFTRTLSTAPPGVVSPVEVTTPISPGMLRVLVDIRLKK